MTDRTVSIGLSANVAGFVAGMAKAEASAKTFMGSLDKSTQKSQAVKQVGTAFGIMGAAAAVGVGIVVKSAMDFESSMSEVEAATGATGKSMDALKAAAMDAGALTKYSATEAASGITELAKAGVSTTDILGGALTGALNLAAAGEVSVADAAATTAITLNQFGLAGTDASHVADVLAAAAGKSATDVMGMAEGMKYVGPIASQMGVSLEETAGTIAYLAQNGIDAGQAGTSLRGMLGALTSPSKLAATEMQQLGLNVYDAQGNFIGFDGVAGQLKATLGNLTNAERDQALGRIFGNDQVTAARLLYSGGAGAVEKWTAAVDDDAYASDTAATKMDNLAGSLELLKGSLETAFIGTGESATGPLKSLVDGLTGLVNAYVALPGPIKTGVLAVGGFIAVLGGVVFALTRVAGAVTSTKLALSTLGITGRQAGEQTAAGMQAASNKSRLLGAGVKAGAGIAGIALKGLSDSLDDSKQGAKAALDIAGDAAMGFAVGGPIGAGIGATIGVVGALANKFGEASREAAALTAAGTEMAATFNEAGSLTATSMEGIVKALQEAGAYTAGDALHIDLGDITKAASTGGKALDGLLAKMQTMADAFAPGGTADLMAKQGGNALGTSVEYAAALANISTITNAVNGQNDVVAEARRVWDENSRATGEAGAAQGNLSGPVGDASGAFDEETASIKELIDAQHTLAGVTLSLYEGHTALRQGLLDAAKASKEMRGAMQKGGQAQVDARAKLSDLAGVWNALPAKVQNAKGAYDNYRDSLVKTAHSMGLSLPVARALAKSILNMPKNTVLGVTTKGDKQALAAAQDIAHKFNAIPKTVRTKLAADGVPANATVKTLMDKYQGLSRQDAKTVLRAIDNASGPLDKVRLKAQDLDKLAPKPKVDADTSGADSNLDKTKGKADQLDKTDPNVTVTADTGNALSNVQNLQSVINNMHGTSVTVTTNYVTTGKPHASGGLVLGPGGPRDDLIDVRLSNGEFVINAGATARNLPLLERINADGYALGGRVGFKKGGHIRGDTDHSGELSNAEQAILDQIAATRDLTKAFAQFKIGLTTDSSEIRGEFSTLFTAVKADLADPSIVKGVHNLADLAAALAGNKKWAHDAAAALQDAMVASFGSFHLGKKADASTIKSESGDLISALSAAAGKDVVKGAKNLLDLAHALKGTKWADEVLAATHDALATSFGAFDIGPKATAADTKSEVHDLEAALRATLGNRAPLLKQVDKLGDSLITNAAKQDKATAALDNLTSAQKSYENTVAASMKHDLFGTGSASTTLMQMQADANDARKMNQALRGARKHGLSGGLFRELAASGDLSTAQQLSHMSKAQIDKFEKAYRARQEATKALGHTAGETMYGDDIRDQTKKLHHLNMTLRHLERSIDKIGHKVEKGSREGTRGGANAGIRDLGKRAHLRRRA